MRSGYPHRATWNRISSRNRTAMAQVDKTAKPKRSWRRWRRPAITVAAVCIAVWVSLVSYVAWAMRQPPETFGRVMSHMPMPAFFVLPFETLWNGARQGHVAVGDIAPSVAVRHLTDTTPVELGSLWAERPVVLVFGSYT